MLTSRQLLPYRFSSDDYKKTEKLKAQFLILRQERQPLYLNQTEFDHILRWKLRGQYARQAKNLSKNTEETICTITGDALTFFHCDINRELEVRLKILCDLGGVGVPVASAILALVYPEKYAVIDFRVWRQVFNEDKKPTSVAQYKRYLKEVYRLSEELQWLPQEVDLAIWEYERVNNRHSCS